MKSAVSEFKNKGFKIKFSLAKINLKSPECNSTGNLSLKLSKFLTDINVTKTILELHEVIFPSITMMNSFCYAASSI